MQRAAIEYVRECGLNGRSRELGKHFFLGSRTGAKWSYQGIRQVCDHLGKKLGFRITSYMFRRLAATQMFASDMPIQNIQHHLGHARTSTTLRYVQAHPRLNHHGVSIMADLMASCGHCESAPDPYFA